MNHPAPLPHPAAPGEAARLGAVLARDASADGRFVYAVTTTGVFCRPSCPSRRPNPDHVRFFDLPEAAVLAGYRPCKRCHPEQAQARTVQLTAVRRACTAIGRHVDAGAEGPPGLREIAAEAGLSRFHLQRVFKLLMGISPKAYADALRMRRLKQHLRADRGVAGAVFDAGFGSASRVYERAPAGLGMTPATYARGGRGASLTYAVGSSSLGLALVAATERGVAAIYLGDDEQTLAAELRRELPHAAIRRDTGPLNGWLGDVLEHLAGRLPHVDLPLDVRATAFQFRVWQELRRIPLGETRTYSEVAEAIGAPLAVRAVGHACATNPVSILVPCHRVLRSDGSLGGYRWGLDRKARLIASERERATAGRAGASAPIRRARSR